MKNKPTLLATSIGIVFLATSSCLFADNTDKKAISSICDAIGEQGKQACIANTNILIKHTACRSLKDDDNNNDQVKECCRPPKDSERNTLADNSNNTPPEDLVPASAEKSDKPLPVAGHQKIINPACQKIFAEFMTEHKIKAKPPKGEKGKKRDDNNDDSQES